ncbi:MAG: calcium-binding protein, partial [Alphaproteobacteria bacterium]
VFPLLSSMDLGITLENVANMTNFDPAGSVATAANFLSHLSLYTHSGSIGQAMSTFSMWSNLDGVNAVIDNTNAQVFPLLSSMDLSITLENVANLTSFADDHDVAGTLRNFSESLSAYTPGFSIETALQATSSDGNLAGFSGVLDYVSSTQWDALSSGFKSGLGSLGISVGTYAANTFAGTNNVDKYFGLGGNDNISGKNGNDFLYGNAGVDIVKGENGNDVLAGGIGADTLTGGGGSDTFVLDNMSGIDKITDFAKASGGDKLDFRDIVSEYDAGDPISQFVAARNVSGNTIVSFDADGAGGAAAVDIAQLTGVTNVNIDTLFAQGQILI